MAYLLRHFFKLKLRILRLNLRILLEHITPCHYKALCEFLRFPFFGIGCSGFNPFFYLKIL